MSTCDGEIAALMDLRRSAKSPFVSSHDCHAECKHRKVHLLLLTLCARKIAARGALPRRSAAEANVRSVTAPCRPSARPSPPLTPLPPRLPPCIGTMDPARLSPTPSSRLRRAGMPRTPSSGARASRRTCRGEAAAGRGTATFPAARACAGCTCGRRRMRSRPRRTRRRRRRRCMYGMGGGDDATCGSFALTTIAAAPLTVARTGGGNARADGTAEGVQLFRRGTRGVRMRCDDLFC